MINWSRLSDADLMRNMRHVCSNLEDGPIELPDDADLARLAFFLLPLGEGPTEGGPGFMAPFESAPIPMPPLDMTEYVTKRAWYMKRRGARLVRYIHSKRRTEVTRRIVAGLSAMWDSHVRSVQPPQLTKNPMRPLGNS